MSHKKMEKIVKSKLTDDLLKSRYKIPGKHKMFGHCYVAAETIYYLLGGKRAGWKPMFIHHEGYPHWFIKNVSGKIIDITSKQFISPVPYHKAIGKGFMTKTPSKRSKKLIQRINENSNKKNTRSSYIGNI